MNIFAHGDRAEREERGVENGERRAEGEERRREKRTASQSASVDVERRVEMFE